VKDISSTNKTNFRVQFKPFQDFESNLSNKECPTIFEFYESFVFKEKLNNLFLQNKYFSDQKA